MPLNMPQGQVSEISFGPARVFLTAWKDPSTNPTGVTPTTDVGFISEDGVTIELTSEKKNILQGNPKLIEYSFVLSQTAVINFTSIQWDFNNFAFALGAGQTSVSASFNPAITDKQGGTTGVRDDDEAYFQFGGNPENTYVAMGIQHQMASQASSNTINIYAWKCQSESGLSLPLGSDEHSFDMSFTVLRSDYDWSGRALANDSQLISIQRQSVAQSNPFSSSSYA